VPLGGTSNHFRREALEETLAWDPFNVTEDADLGFRLALQGWQVGTILAPTLEEAPVGWQAWLGQRTRWSKGWLQTLIVVARTPLATARALGAAGALAIAATFGGAIGTALIHVATVKLLVVALLTGAIPIDWPALVIFALGYGGTMAFMAGGAVRAGKAHVLPALAAVPLYWLAAGVAAILALIDLWRRPFHWQKTAHGRGSRTPTLAAPRVAPKCPVAMSNPASQSIDETVRRLVGLSEQAVASGDHALADVVAALDRMRPRLVADGASAEALALFDLHRRAVAQRLGQSLAP